MTQQQPRNLYTILTRHKVATVFLVAAILLFTGIGRSPVYILDEARNAQAAREMMEHKEWIVPTFNNELRSHKPPLHYYFMRASYSVFGTNAFGARFFSAMMGWLTIWVTWFFTKRFINKNAALWSAVVLLLSTHFLFEFGLAVPDPYLIFFITAGLFLFYAFIKENKTGWLILSAVSFALATLAKGPVALALPALAIGSWLLVVKQFRRLWSWKIILAFAVLVAVALPWYIAVHKATNGQFTHEFFLQHNLSRYGGAMEGHGGIFLLVPLFVGLGLLPISFFLGEALRKRKLIRQNDLAVLCVCVAISFIVFFSFSGTKLPNYPMPCYPFIAVLFGGWIYKAIQEKFAVKQYPFWGLLLLNILLLGGAFTGLLIEPATQSVSGWALIFTIPATAAAISWSMYKKQGLQKALQTLAVGYTLFNFLFLTLAYPAIYKLNPISKTQHLLLKDEQVYSYQIYNPAYNFYLNKPVIVFEKAASIDSLFHVNPLAKVITRANLLPDLNSIPVKVLAKERDLFETPYTVIISGGLSMDN